MTRVTITETALFLRENDGFLILTHRDPDGDTLGSAAGLCVALRALGKQAYVARDPAAEGRLTALTAKFAPPHGFDARARVIVSVDTASEHLFPKAFACYTDHIALSVDHHPGGGAYAQNALIDPGCAATGELMCLLFDEMGLSLTAEMAEPLYIAIATDTGCLRYSNTTSRTLRVVAKLIDTGLCTAEINTELFERKALSRMALEASLVEDAEFFANGRVALMYLSNAKIARTHATFDDTDSIASLSRQIGGVDIGVMLREEKDGKVRVSIRTGISHNAREICKRLGGGGHARAAGCVVEASMYDARVIIIDAIKEEYPDL